MSLIDVVTRSILITALGWLHRARQERQRRVAEQTICDRATKVWTQHSPSAVNLIKSYQRILKQALRLWTNRVIEVKLREYEVAQRYETTVKA